jgi:biotin carboxyl carrier protein
VDLEGATVTALLLTLLVVLSLLMTAQAGYTVYLMLYTWDHDQAYETAGAPRAFRVPQTSFTALLPAHHEEEVIGETLERVMHANYPQRLLEAIVISAKDDAGTIAAAQAAVDQAQANLDLKRNAPTPQDIAVAIAAVEQAQAQVGQAQANVDAATLTAPFAGAVAATGANLGEQVGSGTAVVTLVRRCTPGPMSPPAERC